MDISDSLPSGLTTRPLTMADARSVSRVIGDLQRLEIGSADIEEADIIGDWQVPSVDLATMTIGVFAEDRLVGYAEASRHGTCDAAVHPQWHGQGIGTALARWMQERSRELGATVVGMPVPVGKSGDSLLERLGYRVRWTSWVLQLPAGKTIPERPLPAGYTVRAARPDEYRTVHQVIEDAFQEWAEREPKGFEYFEAGVVGRPGFEPWQVRVVEGPDGIVGAVVLIMARDEEGTLVEGYVQSLAVRRDHRGLGLAQALLVDAFSLARDHGAPVNGLATDSRTGALGLYEKVGMEVTQTWVNRAVDVA